MKKAIVLLLSIILLACSLGSVAYASEPRWDNTARLVYGFEFDNSITGNATANVAGKIGTNKIECQIEIYRQSGSNWIYITGDTQTATNSSLNMQLLITGTSGVYYKAEFTITVYRNGTSEVITRTVYATCP